MTVKTLEQVKLMAQREANRTGSPQCVLNLNRIGMALYVVRGHNAEMPQDRVVFVAHPSTIDQGG
jgi:hypothetical protein